MVSRIADLRVTQAQRHGVIVGLPREDAQRIALVTDLLIAMHDWRDLGFMFDELARHHDSTWKVPVDERWALTFEWVDELGPINIRLIE